jgi:hypothetical protein
LIINKILFYILFPIKIIMSAGFLYFCVFCLFSTTLATTGRPLTARMAFQSLTNGTAFSTDPSYVADLNARWPDLMLDTSSVLLRGPTALHLLDRGYDAQSIGSETVIFSPDGSKIHHHLVFDLPGLFSGELVVMFVAADPQPFQVCLFAFGDRTLLTPDGILTSAANAGVGTVLKAEGHMSRFLNGDARVSGVINQEGPLVAPGVKAFGDILWVVVQTQ